MQLTARFELVMRLIMYRTLPPLQLYASAWCLWRETYLFTLPAIPASVGCHVFYGMELRIVEAL
jgi:hypothetical protein